VRMMGLIMGGMTRHQAGGLVPTIAAAARSPGSRPAE
jgi:hypothetical protein